LISLTNIARYNEQRASVAPPPRLYDMRARDAFRIPGEDMSMREKPATHFSNMSTP
jgi:hypothetical protein